ncbi:MAG: type II toxin-antitoxin system RelE/ParE family toxin [Phycisphaerales bacterium]
MEIVETSVFTKQIRGLLKDDEYRQLQERLVMNPLAGPVIRGSGGLRKLRWTVEGRGKSGGIWVIYYYVTEGDWIFMLAVYAKSAKDDLTAQEVAVLKKLVQEELS